MLTQSLPQEPSPNASKPEWAAWCADVGRLTGAFKVFRCLPDDGRADISTDGKKRHPLAKRPAHAGWQAAASYDRKTVEAMWIDHPQSNIGLLIQPGFVALDADIYTLGKEKELEQFEAEYGKLPTTLEFCSANGGFHLIYSTTRTLGNGLGTLPKFGDVRGGGKGYLVGPGSTVDGKPYLVSELKRPLPLPAHVDSRLVEARVAEAGQRELPPTKIVDDPANIARFTLWLLKDAKLSISGSGGNHTLAATGAMGASYGLTQETTLQLMAEHWNPRHLEIGQEDWTEDELEKHGGSGYRSASSNFGNLADHNWQLLLKAQQAAPGAMPAGPDQIFYTMADIPGAAPARQWAIGDDTDGWVPLGDITTLYGPGGAGKTALAGQMCLAAARGEPLFGLLPVRRMPALLVACEDDPSELHRRFEKQGRRADDNVTFASLLGRDTALHPPFRGPAGEDTWLFNLLSHHLAAMSPGPKFVVLDNLAQLYHGNYTEPSEIARFLNGYLRRLAKQHELTILLLAHPSESQKTSGDGSFGGIGWSAGVRSRLYFERHMTRPMKKGDKPQAIGDERVFSRKKSNYTKAHGDGEGIILGWQDWNFVPVTKAQRAPEGFKPVDAAPATERAAEAAVLPIVQAAVERVLSTNPSKSFHKLQLATDVSHILGQQGHQLSPDTIRKNYLPKLIEQGHPGYDLLSNRGLWRARQTLH